MTMSYANRAAAATANRVSELLVLVRFFEALTSVRVDHTGILQQTNDIRKSSVRARRGHMALR